MPPPQIPYQPYAHLHKDPKGPGDQRPTCMQIIKDSNVIGRLNDKTILITGCSTGIGVETARALYETGAKLVLTVRDVAKGESVIEDIVSNATNKGSVGPRPELLELHLDSLSSVRKAADEFKSRFDGGLNILITKAGVMAPPRGFTKDGFETQFGTNHLAHFLLSQLLKPLLLESASKSGTTSRVVVVSSFGHSMSEVHFDDLDFDKTGYEKWAAYGQSKTANIYMANSITRHYGDRNLIGLSLHPGGIMTELARHMEQADYEMLKIEELHHHFKSVDQGAATSVWAAVSPHFEGKEKGGVYLGDCGECGPLPEEVSTMPAGYAGHAYDEEKEERLWKISCEATGVSAED